MSGLKTLKDMNLLFSKRLELAKEFNKWAEDNNVEKSPLSVIGWFYHRRDDQIRQEAIKRVKFYASTIKDFRIKIDEFTAKVTRTNKGKDLDPIQKLNMGAIIELIEFFNISEDDLQ